jgi:hypothetical protein
MEVDIVGLFYPVLEKNIEQMSCFNGDFVLVNHMLQVSLLRLKLNQDISTQAQQLNQIT